MLISKLLLSTSSLISLSAAAALINQNEFDSVINPNIIFTPHLAKRMDSLEDSRTPLPSLDLPSSRQRFKAFIKLKNNLDTKPGFHQGFYTSYALFRPTSSISRNIEYLVELARPVKVGTTLALTTSITFKAFPFTCASTSVAISTTNSTTTSSSSTFSPELQHIEGPPIFIEKIRIKDQEVELLEMNDWISSISSTSSWPVTSAAPIFANLISSPIFRYIKRLKHLSLLADVPMIIHPATDSITHRKSGGRFTPPHPFVVIPRVPSLGHQLDTQSELNGNSLHEHLCLHKSILEDHLTDLDLIWDDVLLALDSQMHKKDYVHGGLRSLKEVLVETGGSSSSSSSPLPILSYVFHVSSGSEGKIGMSGRVWETTISQITMDMIKSTIGNPYNNMRRIARDILMRLYLPQIDSTSSSGEWQTGDDAEFPAAAETFDEGVDGDLFQLKHAFIQSLKLCGYDKDIILDFEFRSVDR